VLVLPPLIIWVSSAWNARSSVLPFLHSDPLAADSIAADLWLIGDAGLPNPAGEPVLRALTAEIRRAEPGLALVVFLGDNIYPNGLPDSRARGRRVSLLM
jgi:hypothetical protein